MLKVINCQGQLILGGLGYATSIVARLELMKGAQLHPAHHNPQMIPT